MLELIMYVLLLLLVAAMLVDDYCHKNVRFDEDSGGRDPTVALSCTESR